MDMNAELTALLITAATLGVVHTLTGPDHYVPFTVMAKARNWSWGRTMWITTLCGLGHVGSSILLGAIGIAFGIGMAKLELIEGYRGSVAAWLFILFGLGYMIYGIWKARHKHEHKHIDPSGKVNITPWILFTIFAFGPCEPLIPILMFPAAESSVSGIIWVSVVFTLTTIGTMLIMVSALLAGIRVMPMRTIERYMHAIAGFTILMCGVAIEFLGL
jgi:nickel/cobalt transporter (NicO) family protein